MGFCWQQKKDTKKLFVSLHEKAHISTLIDMLLSTTLGYLGTFIFIYYALEIKDKIFCSVFGLFLSKF